MNEKMNRQIETLMYYPANLQQINQKTSKKIDRY